MKALLLLVLLVTSSFAHDAIDAAQPVRQVRLELLVVRLPERRALSLQADLRDPRRATRGQQALLELIEKGDAELVDWPIMRTLGGNRAVSENISEIRYPIEFAQPRVIENPVPPHAAITLKPNAPEIAEINARSKDEGSSSNTSPKLLAGLPTTFETRNTGVTLEVEPVISDDGKTINMQLAPQHVVFKGFNRTTVEAPGQYRVVVDQPEFHTQKLSTNIITRSGEPYLFSFKKLTDPKGTVEIWMLTATVETISIPNAPTPAPNKPANKDTENESRPKEN